MFCLDCSGSLAFAPQRTSRFRPKLSELENLASHYPAVPDRAAPSRAMPTDKDSPTSPRRAKPRQAAPCQAAGIFTKLAPHPCSAQAAA